MQKNKMTAAPADITSATRPVHERSSRLTKCIAPFGSSPTGVRIGANLRRRCRAARTHVRPAAPVLDRGSSRQESFADEQLSEALEQRGAQRLRNDRPQEAIAA